MAKTRKRIALAVAAVLGLLGASLVVAVSPAWAAPVAVDDAYTTQSGTTLTVPAPGLLANDQGLPPNARTVTGGPVPASAAAFQLGTDGSLSYTPHLGFTGTDSFLYCVEGSGQGSCQSNKATVTITVTAPVAMNDAYTTQSGTTLTVPAPGLLANDQGLPPNARTVTGGPVPASAAAFQLGTDGSLSYTPRLGFTGTDSFLYCVEGGGQGSCQSNKATVTITVAAPVAVDDAYTTQAGMTLTVPAPGLLANDMGLPPNARTVTGGPVPASAAAFQLGTDGSLSYTPKPGFTGTDSFLYCVEGGGQGSCQSNKATVTLSVKASPTISTQASPGNLQGGPVRDTATIAGGASPTGTVTFRLFSDAGCNAQVFMSTSPLQGGTATSDSFTPAAAGTYRWTASYSGDAANNAVDGPCNAPNESVTITPFQPPPPTQTITGDFVGPVVVNAGQSVLMANARVSGPVTVNPGGALTVVNSQISQGITADAPAFFSLCGSQVSGPASIPGRGVVVRNATVPLRLGDPASGCAADRVAGDVVLAANSAGLTLGANTVSGNVTVDSNAGAVVVKANTSFKTLACSANTPPPVNAGQANTAASKTGQCAGL